VQFLDLLRIDVNLLRIRVAGLLDIAPSLRLVSEEKVPLDEFEISAIRESVFTAIK